MSEAAMKSVHQFRSNLMILIHNLHIEGLPLNRLKSEYKKYFHQDVTTEKMFEIVGLNPQLLTYELADWPKIFNSKVLYEFFKVGTNAVTKEKVVTCKRGRTIVEMKALTQLASFANIELVTAADKLKYSERGTLNICTSCKEPNYVQFKNKKSISDNINQPNEMDSHNDNTTNSKTESVINAKGPIPLSNIDVNITNQEKVPIYFIHLNDDGESRIESLEVESELQKDNPNTSTSTSKSLSQPVQNYIQPVDESNKPESKTEINCEKGEIEDFEISDHQNNEEDLTDPLENQSSSIGRVTRRSKRQRQVDVDDPLEDANPTKVATRVLKNHLGEIRIIKFLAVEQTCSVCNKKFADEGAFTLHKRMCPFETLECPCGKSFKTKTQLRGHLLFCSEQKSSPVENSRKEISETNVNSTFP